MEAIKGFQQSNETDFWVFKDAQLLLRGERLRDHGGSGGQLGGGCWVQAETGVASWVVALETGCRYILKERVKPDWPE